MHDHEAEHWESITTIASLPAQILVVDDEPISRHLLESQLTTVGYEVRLAEDGQAALAAIAAQPPDLVILDVMMPGLDGYEVARRLKSSDDTSLIPIVMVTALEGGEEKRRALEAGVDDFLPKPFQPLELLLRIKSLLRLKRMYQNLAENNQELQEAYEAVRASETKYRVLIQEAQDAIILVDAQTNAIIEVNRCTLELSGYESDELIGQPATLLCPQANEGPWKPFLNRLAAGKRGMIEEGRLLCRNGEVIPIELRGNTAQHQNQLLTQVVISDLRPRRQREAERQTAERLAAVLETSVTVSHEINNPLFVISGNVEALQHALQSADAEIHVKLERIREACRRIHRVTTQLTAVVTPVSKEYLPGMPMLDLERSTRAVDADTGEESISTDG